MASIRNLKKDIHFLTNELAAECLYKMIIHPESNEETINQIASNGVALRNELLKRAAHSDAKNNPQLVKAYYTKLNKDMMEGYNNLFDSLSALK
jgi:hypothetical protein